MLIRFFYWSCFSFASFALKYFDFDLQSDIKHVKCKLVLMLFRS